MYKYKLGRISEAVPKKPSRLVGVLWWVLPTQKNEPKKGFFICLVVAAWYYIGIRQATAKGRKMVPIKQLAQAAQAQYRAAKTKGWHCACAKVVYAYAIQYGLTAAQTQMAVKTLCRIGVAR